MAIQPIKMRKLVTPSYLSALKQPNGTLPNIPITPRPLDTSATTPIAQPEVIESREITTTSSPLAQRNFKNVIKKNDGIKAGQCGRFVNQITGLGVGDSFESKMAKMNPEITKPAPGMVFTMPYKNTGHIGFIVAINDDGTATVKDSNWSLDEKVKTHKIPISKMTGFTDKAKYSEFGSAVESARKKGASDTEILNYVSQKHPELGQAINKARAKLQAGESDRDITNYLAQKLSGQQLTTPSVPERIQPAMQATAPEKTQGLLSRMGGYIKSDLAGEQETPTFEQGNIGKDMLKTLYQTTLGSKSLSGFVGRAATGLYKVGEMALGIDTEKEYTDLMNSTNELMNQNIQLIKRSRTETDPKKLQKYRELYESNLESIEYSDKTAKNLENKNPTYRNTISSGINTFLTFAPMAKGLGIGGVGTQTGSKIGGFGKGGTTVGLATKFLPESKAITPIATKVLTAGKGVVPRAVESGLMGTGYGVAQNIESGRPLGENLAFSTAFGAAMPIAGTLAGKGARAVGGKLKLSAQDQAARIMNSYIKPSVKYFEYGKNAGRGVAREGIVANNIDDLTTKVASKVDELGAQISEQTAKVQGRATVDNLFNYIDETISTLKKAPSTNAGAMAKLGGIRSDILNFFETDLGGWKSAYNSLDANQVLKLKRFVGELARFTGNISDDKLTNMPVKRTFGMLKEKLNNLASKSGIDLKDINERFADVLTAKIALEQRVNMLQKQNLVSILDKGLIGTGIIGGLVNPVMFAGAIATWGLKTVLSSARFKTRLAAFLLKSSTRQKTDLVSRIPVLRNYVDILFGRGKKPTMKEVMATLDTVTEEVPFKPAGLIEAPKQINLPAISETGRLESVKASGMLPQPNIPLAQPIKMKPLETAKPIEAADNKFYHGTTPDKSNSIVSSGFNIGKGEANGTKGILGEGVYFAKDEEGAKAYGKSVLESNIKKELKLYKTDNSGEFYTKDTDYGDPTKITEMLKKKGYDGVEAKNQIVVFDPSNIINTKKLYAMTGGMAGMEQDENGKFRYNPEKGMAGMALMLGGIKASEALSGKNFKVLNPKSLIDLKEGNIKFGSMESLNSYGGKFIPLENKSGKQIGGISFNDGWTGKTGTIDDIRIYGNHTGKGYGKELVKKAFEESGMTKFELEVGEEVFDKFWKPLGAKMPNRNTNPIGAFGATITKKDFDKAIGSIIKIEPEEAKAVASIFKNFPDLSTKVIGKLEGKTVVSKQFISDLTNSGDLKQAERDIIRAALDTEVEKGVNVQKFADKVKQELLPLKKQEFNSMGTGTKYEGIVLPDELRGNVADYTEHIYNSPIKTSAGETHFSGQTKNYFGHTRVEDMATSEEKMIKLYHGTTPENAKLIRSGAINSGSYLTTSKKLAETYGKEVVEIKVPQSSLERYDFASFRGKTQEEINRMITKNPDEFGVFTYHPNKTRRVIEVQSDLYQKGNLEDKVLGVNTKSDEAIARNEAILRRRVQNAPNENLKRQEQAELDEFLKDKKNLPIQNKGLQKLQQYNDPTAHFRMVREEVKQAAKDGKTKLQFPTGETAMKIEGLGGHEAKWDIIPKGLENDSSTWVEALPNNLKVGQVISKENYVPVEDQWIITDVLSDGKFKAVPRHEIGANRPANMSLDEFDELPQAKKLELTLPKIKDSNKETFDISGKVDTSNPIYKFYEKDLGKYLTNKYQAKRITDSKGVSWYELDVNPEMANKPVEAFGKVQIGALLAGAGLFSGVAVVGKQIRKKVLKGAIKAEVSSMISPKEEEIPKNEEKPAEEVKLTYKVKIPEKLQKSGLPQRAHRNNNPGNIEYGNFAKENGAVPDDDDGRFAKFDTPEEGFEALINLVKKRQSQNLSLAAFVNQYAPPKENDTARYIKFLSSSLNIKPNDRINKVDPIALAKWVASFEGGTKVEES